MPRPLQTRPFEGRVALVTGGSAGIGAELCRKLGEAGASVAIGYLQGQDRARSLADEIAGKGGSAIIAGGDVADPAQVHSLVEAVRAELGPVDILVSNAGRVQRAQLAELDVQAWDRTMAEHLRAAFSLSQEVVPGMRERRWGRLLFMSSIAAYTGGVVGPHYAAAKAGLLGLMHSLASSLAPHGVTANAIAPGLIETGAVGEELRAQLAGQMPMGRLGRPEEVADLAIALLSNAYLTGQAILLDGGRRPDF